MDDIGLPLTDGGRHAEHRDQIRDGRGVDGAALQRAPADGDAAAGHRDLCPHGRQLPQDGPVALPGSGVQPVHRDSLRGKGPHAEEECGVGIVSLGAERCRVAGPLAAGNAVAPVLPGKQDAAPGQSILRHGDISGGFHRPCDLHRALTGEQRQGHQQAGNILGGNIARQGKSAGREPSFGRKQPALLPQGHAVGLKQPGQRLQRPQGQPPLHGEDGLCPQRSRHRQKKPQGGAAFAAGQGTGSRRRRRNGDHLQRVRRNRADIRSQRLQTVYGGPDVVGKAVDGQLHRALPQRGADQQPMGLRFGGGDGHAAVAQTGRKHLRHFTPPAFIQSRSSGAGISRIRQRPMASGTIRCSLPPSSFLSERAA